MEAIAASVVEGVVTNARENLVAWVCRHCGYLIFSNRNVPQLKDKLVELDLARERVQHDIVEAENNLKGIHKDVTKWMGEVGTVTTKAGALRLEHDGRDNKNCFCGWLLNPKACYRLGRETSKMVEDIPELIGRGQFPKVYYENPRGLVMDGAPNLIISAGYHGGTIIESRASILEDIMNALDDEKLRVIGIYGPGGVGKTTLLGEVEEKLRKEKKLFHLIAPTKVSQTPDLKKIQDDIAYALGLNLKSDAGEVGRRDILRQKLKRDSTNKVLIILDDLWEELDLEAVGIPWEDESSKCKFLLTSRFENVLIEMKCAPSISIFHLQGLKYEEALRLFEEIVGNRLKDEEDVRAIAPEVVKKLAGLPLLINSVATNLKHSKLPAWRTALKKIDVTKMETIVKLSYDRLSENAKTLFRVCGLIGGTFPVELLLGLGMGLGLFEESNNTLEDARDELKTMLDSLRSVCLLQDGGDDEEDVTIHDVYSEVIVKTQLGAQDSLVMNSNYGSWWTKEKLEKCWAIRLVDVGRDRLAETLACRFPELEILMLYRRHDDARDYCGPLDFNYMKKLRVLYLRSMQFALLPSSIEILKNLRSLYLAECNIKVVEILGELKALEILSLSGSTISGLAKEIGRLTKLRSLNLSWCYELKTIERGALKGLINLEELYMRQSFDQWMDDREILFELKSLTKLTALEISIPDPTVLLKDNDLPFGNLIRFWIKIGDADEDDSESSRKMMLYLALYDRILSNDWVQKTLQRTQCLHLKGLREYKESAHELCLRGFSQLKRLIIEDSPSIEYIAGSSNGHPPLSAFPSLESLYLENLGNLEEICHGHVECFGKLKELTVQHCPQLKSLWCHSHMQGFVHLEEIIIQNCNSMQAIITYDATNVEATAAYGVVELPNVRQLKLSQLPNVTSFCIDTDGAPIQVSFPCLETLEMRKLPKLKRIGQVECFSKLQDVCVENCPQLQNLFCLLDKQRLVLVQLEEIEILKCDSMQAIITYDARNVEDAAADGIIELPNVRSVELKGLHNMTSFCMDTDGAPIQVSFPHLENLIMDRLPNLEKICHALVDKECFGKLKDVIVRNCNRLKNLWCLSEKQGLVNLQRVEVKKCESMQALITYDARNIEPAADGVVQLPSVLKLNLRELPRMASFCIGADGAPAQLSLPCLEELMLASVGSLRKIWYSGVPQSSFNKLASLKLYYCPDIVNVFPSTIIKGLHNLKEFYVVNCSSLETLVDCGSLDSIINCEKMKEVEEGGQSKERVMSFPSLRVLRIEKCPKVEAFIRSSTSVERLLDEMIEENDESAQPFFNEMVTFPNVTKLKIEGIRCKELWNNQIPHDSFCKLESLSLVACDKLQHIAPSCMWKRLQCCLENLRVISCPLIEVIYEGDETDTKSSKLRSLVMRDLNGLKHIWRSDGQPNVPFPNLRKVGAVRCSHLEILFASFTEKFLGQMEELVVASCDDMKLIADREEGEGAISRQITFLELTALGLRELPQFRSFLPENYSPNFPPLEVLNQKSCGNEPDKNLGDWSDYERRRTNTYCDKEEDFLLWDL